MFYLARVVIVIFTITFSCHAENYITYPLSIKTCPVDGPNPVDLNLSLDSDGLSFTTELNRNLHENCTYQNDIDVWNGLWVPYVKPKGKACASLEQTIRPAWERFKSAINPKIEDGCNIKPGSYSLSGFKVGKDEFAIPISSTGKFRSIINLYCDDEQVGCIEAEMQIEEDEEE
ncbi:uncharacterized protein LOC126739921 [Anthonomus grandis grandis]|uniref:uncharacterized protein LOC126739921 n=1 Tax=Anthonomus grandis grandis TaxID=2921223 RepID=UPI002166AD00|nr:uncharacterized protein LOC126739921 [Anthonomus grandis grandis]